ncbi:hypothetical protein M1N43_00610 [Thermodesulfovibrionales bacterium]|nr:hypothetical protein [Thermodesulfovibrionales bacterium]MCL0075117.1 hypothetical protein [Thermodesulfovibrionales bacterium]
MIKKRTETQDNNGYVTCQGLTPPIFKGERFKLPVVGDFAEKQISN